MVYSAALPIMPSPLHAMSATRMVFCHCRECPLQRVQLGYGCGTKRVTRTSISGIDLKLEGSWSSSLSSSMRTHFHFGKVNVNL